MKNSILVLNGSTIRIYSEVGTPERASRGSRYGEGSFFYRLSKTPNHQFTELLEELGIPGCSIHTPKGFRPGPFELEKETLGVTIKTMGVNHE